jgi:hypothetical protein
MDWLGVLLIAYLMQGAKRIYTDFGAHPQDRPGYTDQGNVWMTIIAGLLWWRRRLLWQIIINLGLTFAIIAGLYWLLGLVIASPGIRLAILMILPVQSFIVVLRHRPHRWW